ncbi:MAG TPA: HAMP domain-containing sensor histidine kinase [Chitinophagaceae bacterium]|nr:HAMP domain-containing sensor histidine kinase [Chitinophagaceae bacterium]
MKTASNKIKWGNYIFLALAVLLFAVSFFFNTLYSSRTSVTREAAIAEKFIQKQQQDFTDFLNNAALVERLAHKKETYPELEKFTSRKYGIFLYETGDFGEIKMLRWSDQLITPPTEMFMAADGEYFTKLSNGWYYIIKRTINGAGADLAFAMIPVWSEFFIETDYLPQQFIFSENAAKWVRLSESVTDFPVRTLTGKTIFYLEKKTVSTVPFNDQFTIWLRFGGLLFLLLFIHLLAEKLSVRIGPWRTIGLLFLVLVLIRGVTYVFPLLLNLRQFELFNPVIYGSDPIQRSLGDLLINASLFCWVVLFAWYKLRGREHPFESMPARWRWIPAILSLVLLIFSSFILANVVRSMVADSKISFDVTNFFGLDRYTIAGFVVLACLSVSYYYLSQLLYQFIFPLFAGRDYLIYFSIGLTGLVYLTTRSGHPQVLFYLPVLCWLLVYTWLIHRQINIFNRLRVNIGGMLAWLFIFSVSIAVIMLSENKKVEWEKRKRMADKMAQSTDRSSEMLMSIAIQYLDADFLRENFNRFGSPESGKKIRDSIIADNYRGYLNRYDTRLYVYDELNRPLFNEDATTYESLNTILTVQAKETEVEGLYYYETDLDKYNYITRRDIKDTSNNRVGTFFIVSNPKIYSNEALFPELFRQFKQMDPENSPTYSIGVYHGGRLISPPGNYSFPIWLKPEELPRREFEQRVNGDFNELWYKSGNEKVVVIARKKETLIQAITLFSYIFCSFLFIVAVVQLLGFVFRTWLNGISLRRMFQLTIRKQIHSTFIFISVFSFVVIFFATVSSFISRYEQNNGEKLSRTMKIMVNEMQKKMADHTTFDDVIKIYDSVSNTGLQALVDEVSDIHGVDVNVYDLNGNLQVSSEGNVYNKGVLSKKMDPMAYYNLEKLRKVLYLQKEKVGTFSFYSMYSPVRDADGQAYAYINIPYFTSQPELEKEISNFLVTIINLNAFIFLIAGLIAVFITNRITDSFSLISDKMKEVNLGKMNEAINWNRNDEIGELVQEYNTMVAKLGASATALAKSEREGAWREMARQVAHEIKNPLTPMKLSIQYLQKAINNNQENVKELSANVANTLVEQIDHLSKIAADFSQFANIGNINTTEFDLHEVIFSLKELYAANEKVSFAWNAAAGPVRLQADKTQMNRLFTNLFANAVEACSEKSHCHIIVNERLGKDTILVSIRDNGEGIPPEMQERIFVPNFTTKSSGTGLGLAMCKGIVEQAKGRIWFETEQGSGTVFHVELPTLTS